MAAASADVGAADMTDIMAIMNTLSNAQKKPMDWEAWTGVPKTDRVGLLGEADKSGSVEVIRSVYDMFLAIYPLCFGYWKKYAEHEWKHAQGNAADVGKAIAVYERAVAAAPHEWSNWVNYATFATANVQDVAAVRRIFERATAVCGTDPKATALWTAWFDFETKHADNDGRPARVLALQTRTGTTAADGAYTKLQGLAASRPAHEAVLPGEEAQVQSETAQAIASGGLSDPEAALRAVTLAKRKADASASAAIASSRASHEASLGKRYWFHVMPLQAAAVNGWRAYLDFEEGVAHDIAAGAGAGSSAAVDVAFARLEKLYGRCLVPCAAYAEFWLRYAAFRREYPDAARAASAVVGVSGAPSAILLQALTHFCPGRVDILVALADALEAEGNGEAALRVYERSYGGSAHVLLPEGVHLLPVPGWAGESAEVAVRFAQAVLRIRGQAGTGQASEILRALIAKLSGKEGSRRVLGPVYAELARVYATCGDHGRAAEAWTEGSAVCGGSLAYWQAWAGAAAQYGLEGGAVAVYARALSLDDDGRPRSRAVSADAVEALPRDEDRALAWQLYLEALRATPGTPAALLAVAGDEYRRWSRRVAAAAAEGASGASGPRATADVMVAVAGRKRPLPTDAGHDEPATNVAHV